MKSAGCVDELILCGRRRCERLSDKERHEHDVGGGEVGSDGVADERLLRVQPRIQEETRVQVLRTQQTLIALSSSLLSFPRVFNFETSLHLCLF